MAIEESDREVEAYADDAPLMALFGTPAKTKLLSVFVAEKGRDLSKSEIARQAGVARSTVYDHLDGLEALGIVEQTRTIGDSPMYQIVHQSELVQHVAAVEDLLLKRLLELDEGTSELSED